MSKRPGLSRKRNADDSRQHLAPPQAPRKRKSSDALEISNLRRKVVQDGSHSIEVWQRSARQCLQGRDNGQNTSKEGSDQDKSKTKDTVPNSESCADAIKLDTDKANAIEPGSSDKSSQEPWEDLIARGRKVTRERIEGGKRKGWVSDTLKGQCCHCESSLGFSRGRDRCRNCSIHDFCNFCTRLEETEDEDERGDEQHA